MGRYIEYEVIGRKLPTEKEPHPKLFRMTLFATNEVVAKSRYWYFLKKVSKVKKTSGEIVSLKVVKEKKPLVPKVFGIWLRYDSRSGTHNMYKEYRELSRTDAVEACYSDMASRHRARFRSVQIIRVAQINAKAAKRPYIQQLITKNLKFALPHRILKPVDKRNQSLFIAHHPSTIV